MADTVHYGGTWRMSGDGQPAAELARLLRQLRRREARQRGAQELTYRELAAKTGWSLGIIAQYFSGKSVPPVDRFDALARFLGATSAEQGAFASARDRAADSRRKGASSTLTGPRFLLLGPVIAVGPHGAARLVGARQRAIVALLALNHNKPLTPPQLVDALWGENPPRTAIDTLYSHIARIRRAFDTCGLRGVLHTESSGYLLAAPPEDFDSTRFEQRTAQVKKSRGVGTLPQVITHLKEALSLWRGDALADAPVHGWGAAEVHRLHEIRSRAQEDLWEARLGTGEHAPAVGELERLLVADPARERLVELLMLALYRCGRPNEATEVYQRLRQHLATELGVEPNRQVQQLNAAILRRKPELDPPSSKSSPAQLPPVVGHFTGRDAELAVLDGLLDDPSRVGVVCGPAGMGKTALAVRWAAGVAGRYPDGQLFADLRGHDPATALPASDVLAHILTGLGVAPADFPAGFSAKLGLYRTLLRRRRVLILLDNSAGISQVADLVPPEPSQLLVTSRNTMIGLAVHHAVSTVDLSALLENDSIMLLRRVLGADRVATELSAAYDLAQRCGGMPLALRIAAANLAAQPTARIATLAVDLAGPGVLEALSVPGDSRSVRSAFAGAYRALTAPAARLFRLLGRHPGPTFTASLAVALAEVPAHVTQLALGELVAAHLVNASSRDRYHFHDLIGVYARELSEPPEARRSAARIVDWYLTAGDTANRIFSPTRDRAGPIAADPPIEPPAIASHEDALSLLDGELPNLIPVIHLAAEQDDDNAAWRLAYLFTGFLTLRGHSLSRLEMCRHGLAAAQRVGDQPAEAVMRSLFGLACYEMQDFAAALEHHQAALALMTALRDLQGQGMALNNIALVQTQLGLLEPAMAALEQALALHTANNNLPAMTSVLNNIGHLHLQLGRPDAARSYLTQALANSRELGLPRHEAFNLISLGETHRAEDDPDRALVHFAAALAIRQRLGERRLAADTLNLIGQTQRDCGDHAAAAASFRSALALAQAMGDQQLEAVTQSYLDGS